MRYYAAKSAHGSESSYGFCNDTIVMVFSSRQTRDQYVSASRNLSTKSIKREDVTRAATNWSLTRNKMIRPQPFTEEYWGIVDYGIIEDIPGFVGTIEVCGGICGNELAERFYR